MPYDVGQFPGSEVLLVKAPHEVGIADKDAELTSRVLGWRSQGQSPHMNLAQGGVS